MEQPLVRLQSVSKRYYLREPRLVQRAARALLASWIYERNREFWALRDIDIELHPGQALGLIGVNGSGKSTLLKLMAGVSSPTSGSVDIRGDIAAMLELGAGFHPDLTGYQNIYLQCNLLGLRKAQIDQRLEQIIEFSGLHECLEWPVKRYSSGMYARLAFSVALHVGARVILVDEILAVGDSEFQRRGINRMNEIRDQGDSIFVLVTHDIQLARQFCTELIWLDQGKILSRGDPQEISRDYWNHVLPMMMEASGQIGDQQLCERALKSRPASSPLRIEGVEFRNEQGQAIKKTPARVPVHLAIELEAREDIADAAFDLFFIARQESPIAEMRSEDLMERLTIPAGKSTLVVRLDPQLLLSEDYSATVLLYTDETRTICLDAAFRASTLKVSDDPAQSLHSPMRHPHEWRFENMAAVRSVAKIV